MAQHDTNTSSTASAEQDIQEIKKNIDALIKHLGNLKDKSGDVMSEQIDNLADAIASLKDKGEKKSEEMLHEISNSTRKHPIRNLAYAFGIGVVISLIVK